MENQTLILITVALIGIAVGAFIMYLLSAKSSGSAKSVAEVEEKLTKYQEDVVSHFEQTADLVDELTQSYKKVFDHLGQSARELLTEEQVKVQIEKRKDKKITLAFLADETLSTAEELQETNDVKDGLEKNVEELVEEIEVEMNKPNNS
ncbi:MAG: YhcB family protein [Proteobacteria bacterium]|nr:YhcB family protein [Pseudomonadota bacterium]